MRRKNLFRLPEILFLILAPLFLAQLASLPQASIALHYLRGKTTCSLLRALAVPDEVERMNDRSMSIMRQSRIGPPDAIGLAEWKTPYGSYWAPNQTPVHFLISEQKSGIYLDGGRGIRPGDIVLDCGSNIGTFTREALNAGAALVVAIEPSARNVECLRRNFPAEVRTGRVIVYPKGVWHRDEVLKMLVYENSALDSFVMRDRAEEDKKPREVAFPVTTVDRIVEELGLRRVDFIKIDVEGAERNALEGAQTTLARFRPGLAVATENLKDDQHVIPGLVRKFWSGYRQECGQCRPAEDNEIRPEVLFFY